MKRGMYNIKTFLYTFHRILVRIFDSKGDFGKNKNFLKLREQSSNCCLFQNGAMLKIKIFLFLLKHRVVSILSRLLLSN
jgi:hypothetical protein